MSTKKLKVLISNSFDPWFNLATEDWIFRDMDTDCEILFLWRNDQTVVIGRFQNPWSECHTDLMDKDNIKLARRQSGGGAVFHDLGNTNFTFLSAKENFNKSLNNSIIINSLKHFGIEAYASGRNDLIIKTDDGDRKFSGSAFKETKDRSFHHGTLLINTNLQKLAKYLNPHPKKLESKGIVSVKSRVVNLIDLNSNIEHESLSKSIIKEFFTAHNVEYDISCIEYLEFDKLQNIIKLNEHYLRIKDWSWRFGEAPNFTHNLTEYFTWGLVEVQLNVEKGEVIASKIFTDSLHPEMIEQLMASLINVPYTKIAFTNAILKLSHDFPMYEEYLMEFSDWITKEIN